MKSYKKIILPLICLVAFLITAMCGCAAKKYNAVIYDKAIDFNWLTETYLLENLLNKCNNGDIKVFDNRIHYDGSDETETIDFIYPSKRINVIETQEEFDRAFVEFPDEVDFDKQMLIVYFFVSTNTIYIDGERRMKYSIKDIKLQSKELKITLKSRRVGWIGEMLKGYFLFSEPAYASSAPMRRCLIIKMDKVNFDTVTVE